MIQWFENFYNSVAHADAKLIISAVLIFLGIKALSHVVESAVIVQILSKEKKS